MGIGGLDISGGYGGEISFPFGLSDQGLDFKGNPTLSFKFNQLTTLPSAITYTGGVNGAKYDSDGVLGYAPHNMLLQSEDLTTTWTEPNSDVTITANAGIAPDGSTTADDLKHDDSSSAGLLQGYTVPVAGAIYTASAYVKQGSTGSHDWVRLQLHDGDDGAEAWFNVATGAKGALAAIGAGSNTNSTITSIGSGWYRITVTMQADATDVTHKVYLSNVTADSGTTEEDTNSVWWWGIQVNIGATALTYVPTTTAAVWTARFDHSYDGTSWNPLGLLIEEARTNICLQSEDWTSGSWGTLARFTRTADQTTAPDGNTTADKLLETTDDNTRLIRQTIDNLVFSATSDYTWSIYVKGGLGRDWLALGTTTLASDSSQNTHFDITNGTIGTTAAAHTPFIQDVGNGWFRIGVTFDSGTGTTDLRFNFWGAISDNDRSYIGVATKGYYVWGAQLEAGAFPTSYVRTTTAAVARTADNTTMTGTNFSDWYNNVAGTFLIEAAPAASGVALHVLGVSKPSSSADFHNVLTSSGTAGRLQYHTKSGNGSQGYINIDDADWEAGDSWKLAIAYATDDRSASRNGAATVTDNGTTLPVAAEMTILSIGQSPWGGGQINGHISRITYWPTRLSDEILQVETS
tara:strand:+ start:284 stop:2182 length:1899 start_codon:yes stop_codon:yes gene_type:complete